LPDLLFKSSVLDTVIDRIEQVGIAIILALMTLITFTNVVLRYVFNDSLIWGLEVTSHLFAWLILFGVSHCFKISAHLGVDVLIMWVSPQLRRLIGLIAAVVCLAYAFFLLKGAWDYWAPFVGLYETTGRWIPTGIDWTTRDRAWYETVQIPMFDFLRFLEPLINQNEPYEKLPRFIPYLILPVGVTLLFIRLVQVTVRIWHGHADKMIASHELEENE